jgi:hypothetical protein
MNAVVASQVNAKHRSIQDLKVGMSPAYTSVPQDDVAESVPAYNRIGLIEKIKTGFTARW